MDKIEHKQQKVSKDVGTLNAVLKKSASLLSQPEELIDVTMVSFCVDRFNQIIKDCEENEQYRINLAQVCHSESN